MWTHHTVVPTTHNVSATAVLRNPEHPLTLAWHSLNKVVEDLESRLAQQPEILDSFNVAEDRRHAIEEVLAVACVLWLALAIEVMLPVGVSSLASRSFWSKPLPFLRQMVERNLWQLVPN